MHRASNLLRRGEHRGGMFVAVEGKDAQGRSIERSWHLLAEGDDGPYIPAMAAAAIIRHCLEGRRPSAGARPATTDLELVDYEGLFRRRAIYTGNRERGPAIDPMPLYRRILGGAWGALPEPLQRMHDVKSETTAEGLASVDRGTGLIARVTAALFGFPRKGRDVPVKLFFHAGEGREIWQRSFGTRSFMSHQQEGRGRFDRLLRETFGPVAVGLALVVQDGRLHFVVRRWTVLGVPLPLALAPRGQVYEFAEDGRFHFHVEISHPLIGLIVRYRGWLVPRSAR